MAQINKPSDYFNTVLYTGDNTSNRSITGVGFQPSFVWNKNRSASANHNLWNEVTGITERLTSSGNQASEDYSSEFLSFDSDGVTITQNAASLDINNSSYNYVLWNWLAGGSASSNTDGSITSSVSANTTAGFSVVTYSGNSTAGATVGHGLGAVPQMIIVKGRDATINWQVYHQAIGNTNYLELDTTDASTVSSARWNNTTPTSSVFSLGTGTGVNAGFDYVAYCFAEKKGFSKFGSYTGNGNADGTFVYTGFKPAMIIFKNTTGEFWNIFDNKRDPFNEADAKLYPNGSNAEASTSQLDFVSNGFKLRSSEPEFNQSGTEIIYMAFAENPLVGTNNIPATAR